MLDKPTSKKEMNKVNSAILQPSSKKRLIMTPRSEFTVPQSCLKKDIEPVMISTTSEERWSEVK